MIAPNDSQRPMTKVEHDCVYTCTFSDNDLALFVEVDYIIN